MSVPATVSRSQRALWPNFSHTASPGPMMTWYTISSEPGSRATPWARAVVGVEAAAVSASAPRSSALPPIDDPTELVSDAHPAEEPDQPGQREPHDGEVVPIDALDDRRAVSLNAVRARLVHGLPGGDVALDLVIVELAERDVHRFHLRLHAAAARHRHGGMHHVPAPGEGAEHAASIGPVTRLAEDLAIHLDDGVGRDHARPR